MNLDTFCMTKHCPRIGKCHVFKVIFYMQTIIVKQRWFKWLSSFLEPAKRRPMKKFTIETSTRERESERSEKSHPLVFLVVCGCDIFIQRLIYDHKWSPFFEWPLKHTHSYKRNKLNYPLVKRRQRISHLHVRTLVFDKNNNFIYVKRATTQLRHNIQMYNINKRRRAVYMTHTEPESTRKWACVYY